MEAMDTIPIMAETINVWTQKDCLLARVYKYVQFGWPEHCSADLKTYSKYKLELSTLKWMHYLWFLSSDFISRQTINVSRVTSGTPRSELDEEFAKNVFLVAWVDKGY